MADRAIIVCAADLGEYGHCELPVDHDGIHAGAPPEAEQKLYDLMGRVEATAMEVTEPDDVALTPSQAFTAAVTVLRRHAAVCHRPMADRLVAVADLIEGAVEPDQHLAEVERLRRERDSLARRCAVRFEEAEAARAVVRRLLDGWSVIRTTAPWGREWHGPDGDLYATSAAEDAVLDAVAAVERDDRGVAAGPQTTPRVLWEGTIGELFGRVIAHGNGYSTEDRVRVVVAPTSQEDDDGR